jgi:phage-related holin
MFCDSLRAVQGYISSEGVNITESGSKHGFSISTLIVQNIQASS